MTRISDNTLLSDITVADLKKILSGLNEQTEKKGTSTRKIRYIYGLKGIRDLFKCSHPTAQKYKDTFRKDAILQNGKKIIIDADLAMKLFKDWEKNR